MPPKKKVAEPIKLERANLELSGAAFPVEVNPKNENEIKLACNRVGVSLDDYISAIKFALAATKITGKDEDGYPLTEPDHDKRLKAALMGLELEGYIRNKTPISDNRNYTQVIYSFKKDD